MRRMTIMAGVITLALLAGSGCLGEPTPTETLEQEVQVCPAGATTEGIDVSYHQGTINWSVADPLDWNINWRVPLG